AADAAEKEPDQEAVQEKTKALEVDKEAISEELLKTEQPDVVTEQAPEPSEESDQPALEVSEAPEAKEDTILEQPVEAEKAQKEVTEEPEKKFKKKGKKAKPKREEIIDEDTLEELRKAFRAKLPGKRREY
ncbi:MAG: hypothetical protein GWN31_13225, partial [Candidatus Thorarchaeota archaeon]|nr:hypothetical protein [Candidatus Thorarchaeota archaeon]